MDELNLIMISTSMHEYAAITPISFECEVGTGDASNDFELRGYDVFQGGVYIPGTEYGGLIECPEDTTGEDLHTYKGWTWRGLLTQAVVSPPDGEDYYTASGDLHEIMSGLVTDRFSGLFTVPGELTGVTAEFQADRFCTVHEALTDLCEENGYKLVIEAYKSDTVKVELRAEPVVTVAGVYNEDNRLSLTFADNRMGINHLICMGSGELKDRQRVDLYVDQNGNIGTTKYHTGLYEREQYFDYPNAESITELTKQGKKRLKEVMSKKTLQINRIQDVEMDIGDIVTGKHTVSGTSVSAPIDRKSFAYSGGIVRLEYHVKEDR